MDSKFHFSQDFLSGREYVLGSGDDTHVTIVWQVKLMQTLFSRLNEGKHCSFLGVALLQPLPKRGQKGPLLVLQM